MCLNTQATKWVLISILSMSPFRARLLGLIVLSSSRPIKQGANFKTLDSKMCSHSCSWTKSHILMRRSLKTLKWPTKNIGNKLHYKLTFRLVKHETYGFHWTPCFEIFALILYTMIPCSILHNGVWFQLGLCIIYIWHLGYVYWSLYKTNLYKVFIHLKIILKIILILSLSLILIGHSSSLSSYPWNPPIRIIIQINMNSQKQPP